MSKTLADIALDGSGAFGTEGADFRVTQFRLPRPWHYIYTTPRLLLRMAHDGTGYAQVSPPAGMVLFRQERFETHPTFYMSIETEEARRSATSSIRMASARTVNRTFTSARSGRSAPPTGCAATTGRSPPT